MERFGADQDALRLLDVDGPDLLPYATLLAAREAGNEDLRAIAAVYEWQGTPLIFIMSAEDVDSDRGRLHRIRRLLAMRGDAPYLGVVSAGRLEVYLIGLDDSQTSGARVDIGVADGQEIATLAHLANARPGVPNGNRQWISHVVLKLLGTSIDTLRTVCGVEDDDAISLVGRALFTRFLGDRHLLSSLGVDAYSAAELFDDARRAEATSNWLDQTFNGDFLPTSHGIWNRLPEEAFKVLGDILRRAPGGTLYLGWQERWDNLDFAHIPVGVLSQAYEHYLHQHSPDRQRREGGYYTPRPIADLMVRGGLNAVGRTQPCHTARILDPSAGAGVFLLTAFRQLVAERWRADGQRPDTETLRSILYEQITGFDINEAALRFAALGLYLMSIELDANPEPIHKLRFKNLRGRVLLKMARDDERRALGSLGPAVGDEHVASYDLVIGNPPWASGTGLPEWSDVQSIVRRIAQERLPESPPPPLPNEVLDLPFVWRAMEWARPGGQIAFALHARLLFQQGDGMQDARRALFCALNVTGVINGVELRQTKVWPEIDAPFCIIYANNQLPPQGSGFRLVSPRLESALNNAGGMRIDATNAEPITTEELISRPEILKLLFKGSRADVQVYDRLQSHAPVRLGDYWRQLFGSDGGRGRFAGNGYQRLKRSSRIRKTGDGKPGVPAQYLHGRRLITPHTIKGMLISSDDLPVFDEERIHDPRSETLFDGPLMVVQKAPPASLGRIRTAVIPAGAVFNASFYGYSGRHYDRGAELVRYLSLVIGSKIALWQVLITSGEFAFERDTIEKATIDGLWLPPLESLAEHERAYASKLFEAVSSGAVDAWDEVDRWVASIYHLRPRDLQVILDTLEYGLPFSKNRKLAQEPASEDKVRQFCETLTSELLPWADRLQRKISAAPAPRLSASPWRGVCVSLGAQEGCAETEPVDWARFLPLADHFAATEVVFSQGTDCLWLGRLDQARYWSATQARLVAQRLAWEHMDALRGRGAA
ncbi:N-6 DNA methylase [Brevundimonas sp.]|uniref:HsdM family class I SAM-dependent methyltransferase n=1 Tax=Brevundimonas sp. TaxID=1871086 RepID=UPI0028AE0457|nr:N-6 DNA methylase [Brevundimonas sp.]